MQVFSERELHPMAVWITYVGHFFWDSLGQSCWFGWFRVCVGLISGSSHVQTCAAQPRWIPAKGPMGSFGITPFLTSKELSSQEGLPDFENEKHVVSLLVRAQPPLSVVLLILWSSCLQRMSSSAHLGWEGHLHFLKLVQSTLLTSTPADSGAGVCSSSSTQLSALCSQHRNCLVVFL